MKRYLTLSSTAWAATFIAALAITAQTMPRPATASDHAPTIPQLAGEAGSFATLLAAVDAADLRETLSGEGPFTVLAPTDDAFAALPEGTVESLLEPGNQAALTSVLTYHVIPGRHSLADLAARRHVETVQGQRIAIGIETGQVRFGDANVKAQDLEASNGIVHVIDAVIMPAMDDLVVTADKTGTFKTLLAAAEAAGLVDALKGEGPLTILAPADDAFAKLPAGTVETLLKPENRDALTAVLKLHVIAGRLYSDQAIGGATVASLEGTELSIGLTDGRLTAGGAMIIATDIEASNGVVHVIDRVILPDTEKVSSKAAPTRSHSACPSMGAAR